MRLLEEVDLMKENDFNLSNFVPIDTAKVKAAFLKVVPMISSELDAISAGPKSGLEELKDVSPKIESYLSSVCTISVRSSRYAANVKNLSKLSGCTQNGQESCTLQCGVGLA